ncbi:FRAS1-related extracellular matrix 1, partial [Schistosoma japonicum]
MELNWIKLGFNHKLYTICSIKGILTLTVIRKGTNKTIQSTLTDVYIGLSSDTAIEGKDFSLHSQKLVVFQK